MSRATFHRLARLEAAQPEHVGKWHRIIVREGEDAEPIMAAMFASGEAQEGDHFVVHRIVSPPARESASSRSRS